MQDNSGGGCPGLRPRESAQGAFNEGLTVEEYRPADNRGINEILSVYELAFGEESKNGNQA